MLIIRPEGVHDVEAVRQVNQLGFGRPDESRIVDAVRAGGHKTFSLVAVEGATIVGHILFSPARIIGNGAPLRGMGLAPMAVHPEFQRRGIGSELVREGLHQLDVEACPFVIVLGHAAFYPRFGFERASRFGVRPQWDSVPDDVFFIRFLPGMSPRSSGTAHYLPEFDPH